MFISPISLERRSLLAGGLALMTSGCSSMPKATDFGTKHWVFDQFDQIGGYTPLIEGQPRLTLSPYGQAILF